MMSPEWASALVAAAALLGTLLGAAKAVGAHKRGQKVLEDGQTELAKTVSAGHAHLEGLINSLAATVNQMRVDAGEVQVRLEAFEGLETERHGKSDAQMERLYQHMSVAIDEVRGATNRHNLEIHQLQVWQATIDERLKRPKRSLDSEHPGDSQDG